MARRPLRWGTLPVRSGGPGRMAARRETPVTPIARACPLAPARGRLGRGGIGSPAAARRSPPQRRCGFTGPTAAIRRKCRRRWGRAFPFDLPRGGGGVRVIFRHVPATRRRAYAMSSVSAWRSELSFRSRNGVGRRNTPSWTPRVQRGTHNARCFALVASAALTTTTPFLPSGGDLFVDSRSRLHLEPNDEGLTMMWTTRTATRVARAVGSGSTKGVVLGVQVVHLMMVLQSVCPLDRDQLPCCFVRHAGMQRAAQRNVTRQGDVASMAQRSDCDRVQLRG